MADKELLKVYLEVKNFNEIRASSKQELQRNCLVFFSTSAQTLV